MNMPEENISLEEKVKNLQESPHDIATEEALIGALLWNGDKIHDVEDIVSSESFYSPRHQKIYSVMVHLARKGDAIDSVTVVAELDSQNQLESVGGRDAVKNLVEQSPSAAAIKTYAKTVQDKFIRRRLLDAAENISSISYDTKQLTEDILNLAEKELFQITQKHTYARYRGIDEIVPDLLQDIVTAAENPNKHRGITTGFKNLDNALSGLHKSDLIILAARPSVGKTAFALEIARRSARSENTRIGFLSLEMSHQQLVERLLSAESNMNAWRLRTGNITEKEDFSKLNEAAGKLSTLPIFIDDRSSMSTLNIRSTARRMKREHDIQILIVDYLQLITPYESKRSDSLVQHITEVSHTLKQIARELEIPVIALSQLSREIEKRAGKPRLSDLRDSGSIEQDADIVMFLHRSTDNNYEGDESSPQEIDLLIEKHRNGPTGKVSYYFDRKLATFNEPADNSYDEINPELEE